MKKIGIVANTTKPDWLDTARHIVELVAGRGVKVVLEPKEAHEALFPDERASDKGRLGDSDMVLSLGGDGTFLKAVRLVGDGDVPIVGVNLGGLGFLAEFSAQDFVPCLNKILSGDYRIDERMTLETCLAREGETIRTDRALNDVVINVTGVSRLAVLRTSIDDEYLTTYEADGLIIATPTGSTAYSLSAGGPIVEPSLDAIVLTPICPHSLSNRPILLPSHKAVQICPLKVPEGAIVTVDGQTAFELLCGDVVTVARASKNVKLITTRETSYFEILRSKLGWRGSKEP